MAEPSRLPSIRRIGGAAGAGSKSRPMSMFEVSADHLKKLRSLGDSSSNDPSDGTVTPKQSKRRSLLPQFSSRKGPADVKETVAAIKEDDVESTETSSVSDTTHDDRKAMPPPAKPVRALEKPSSPVKGIANVSHARTISKDSVVGRSNTPASTRMPHLPTARTSSLQKHTRTTSNISIRPPTSSGRPPTSGSITASLQPNSISPPRPLSRANAKSGLPPPSKPTFSTYQQHFSPAKSVLPKPPVPNTKTQAIATPRSDEEEESPAIYEATKEQIELLQLSLLHQASASTLRAYEYSAKHKLSHRHAKLQQEFHMIEEEEREQRKQNNLEALDVWCVDGALLAEHLQILDHVVADVRSLTEPGGRFADMTTTFEDWLVGAEQCLMGSSEKRSFVDSLPETWKTTHTSLAIKLRSVQHDLELFPPLPKESNPDNPSSLRLIMKSCSALIDGMLKELDVMMRTQKEVMQRSRELVDSQVNDLMGSSDGILEKETWAPAWHTKPSDVLEQPS